MADHHGTIVDCVELDVEKNKRLAFEWVSKCVELASHSAHKSLSWDKYFRAINCTGSINQTTTKRKYTKHVVAREVWVQSICVPSFIPIHWLVFAVLLLTPKTRRRTWWWRWDDPCHPYMLRTTVLNDFGISVSNCPFTSTFGGRGLAAYFPKWCHLSFYPWKGISLLGNTLIGP